MRRSAPVKVLALLLLLWLSSNEMGCVVPVSPPETITTWPTNSLDGLQSECLPQFPNDNEWYGGDAAYSVPLTTGEGRTSLWLFGDSFVRHPDMPEGRTYPFVHNTIGISRCDADGTWRLDTFWHRDDRGSPRAFFAPDPDANWVGMADEYATTPPYYWLFDGFIAHDVLFIGLLRVVPSEPRGAFNLPFRLAGVDLARIENYRDPPSHWRVQISTLSDSTLAFPASAFVVTRSHLFAFAFFDRGDGRSPRMLSRLDLDVLKRWKPDLSEDLETLALDSRWQSGFSPDEAKLVMDDDASEMSVHFDTRTNSWIAVYSNLTRTNEVHRPTAIQIRTARALAGPWSEPEDLAVIPETDPGHARSSDRNLFCYAAKAHPQFASPGELVVTYVCNLFARNSDETIEILERLQESGDLYRPRALSLPIPPALESTLDSR